MTERKRRVFPDAFKSEAVERVRMSGMTITAVAEELGLHETVLRRWIARFGGGAAATALRRPTPMPVTPPPADLAAHNARPKCELHRAETERDVLEKAALAIVLEPMAHKARSSAGPAGDLPVRPLSGHCFAMPCRAMDEHRDVWPVRMMCRVMGVSVSGYYAWRSRPESRRTRENRGLLAEIRDIHADSGGVYGSPRVHAVLRSLGRMIGRNRIARLMRAAGLRGLAALPRRIRTTDSRHSFPIAANRIGRDFTASAPNQVWLADLTCIPTGEGWLYLAALIDMHTRKVVGWAMRETLHAGIAVEALRMAIERQRPAPGLIQHSDRGVQYAADAYRQTLAAAGITPSPLVVRRRTTVGRWMSRRGNCLDNAPMESFSFEVALGPVAGRPSPLKVERVHHRLYATRNEARRDLFGYIEGFYNSRRLHSALGYRSPADMKRMAA